MLDPKSPVDLLIRVPKFDARNLPLLLILCASWCQSCVLMTTDDIRMCDEV